MRLNVDVYVCHASQKAHEPLKVTTSNLPWL